MKLLSILTFAVAVSAIKCGKTVYTEEQVKAADESACKHVQDHTKAGNYPHVYKNYEKFKFKGLGGPFYEFPLKTTPYKGGSPGPDRVIITGKCDRAGEITHTGAKTKGGFVACSGTTF
ncbi:TPA_exp: Uncharacterized protein A8136_1015 [Trichophyton benhamiae CBS 112371]|nr:TPA_exp: Uncharacterized protein A8136_1015 [Trichophyton benhamiae CBS 112371]